MRVVPVMTGRLGHPLSNNQDKQRIALRREQVAQLSLLGHEVQSIASRLGATRQTIARDLEVIRGEWLASAGENLDTLKARELARLDSLEREYWAAWDRSVAAHNHSPDDPQEEPESRRRAAPKDPVGDPRFLDGVEWCIDRRCKLLGLDSPKKPDAGASDSIKFVAGINWDDV